MLPWPSRTIDHSRPAISQARKPALTPSSTMTRLRRGYLDLRTYPSMRLSMPGVITLACRPAMGELLSALVARLRALACCEDGVQQSRPVRWEAAGRAAEHAYMQQRSRGSSASSRVAAAKCCVNIVLI